MNDSTAPSVTESNTAPEITPAGWPCCTPSQEAAPIDGFSNHHSETDITRDRQRHRWLQAHGYQVIRFSNQEVLADARGCAAAADDLIQKLTAR